MTIEARWEMRLQIPAVLRRSRALIRAELAVFTQIVEVDVEPLFARGIIGSKLPAIFPLSSVFSSTVIASGTPPFGVQLPDQVPLIAVRSAGATGASSSNNNVMNTKSIVFIATSGEFQIPVSRAAPGGSRQTIES